jgi:uncharacterized protein (TIGR00730 family)
MPPRPLRTLCIFCGSSRGAHPAYAEAATAMGTALAERGIGLVYGGGRVGLMGIVADAVLAAGGEAHGVIPSFLADKEVGHHGLTRLDVVDSMHERKARMAELSDGFIALPGGIGTLEEIAEIWTWSQLGLHQKPIGVLNVAGFYNGLLSFIDHAVAEAFLRPDHARTVLREARPVALIDAMAAYTPEVVEKWIGRDQQT